MLIKPVLLSQTDCGSELAKTLPRDCKDWYD